jgi:hypothetical protein
MCVVQFGLKKKITGNHITTFLNSFLVSGLLTKVVAMQLVTKASI